MRRAGTGVVADRPVFSTSNLNSAHIYFYNIYIYINICISKPGIQMKNEKSGFLGVMGPVPCEEPRTTFNLWVGGVFVVSLHPGKAVWEGCWEIHFLALCQISR